MTSVEVPGKLFISGEYAVLKGAHAVLAPLTRGMVFECVRSANPRFASSMHGVVSLDEGPRLPQEVAAPWRVAREYLTLQGVRPKPFLMTVHSRLAIEGMKLGLGSSGAFTVGFIRSVLAYHGVRVDALTLYKLAVISQINAIHHASFGDLAVSAFGSWILYRKPETEWLRRHGDRGLATLLNAPWPGLRISPFTPSDVNALALNTKTPAQSKALVEAFEEGFDTEGDAPFTTTMDRLSLTLHEALVHGRDVTGAFRAAHRALETLAVSHGLPLFPVPVQRAVEKLESLGATAKLSGAGGGDCVLGFFRHKTDYRRALVHLDQGSYPVIHLLEVDA